MLTEFELIRRFFSPSTEHTVLAGGDDAALIVVQSGHELAISVDTMVSGRHFFADAPAASVGHKSLATNLSDMAAMGALPRWATLSLTLPAIDEAWLEAFSSGLMRLAQTYNVDLIGGDTTGGPLAVCIQILGEVEHGRALRRSGAQAGDDVWVSGALGGAALALAHLRGERVLPDELRIDALARLHEPQPRVALGRELIGVAHSCIDVSDGLVADLGHIAERSSVRVALDWASVPLPSGCDRLDPFVQHAALSGGDDYELAFTAPPTQRDALEQIARRIELPLTRIGVVAHGSGVIVRDRGGAALSLEAAGFQHFL